MNWSRAHAAARDLSSRFDVRGVSDDRPVGTLSGGNQQKLVLARELGLHPPKVIVAVNPTRGLDPAATEAVHRELLRHRDRGAAIVLISTELDELVKLADRIAVLYRGRLMMSAFPEAGVEQIGQLMAGVGAG